MSFIKGKNIFLMVTACMVMLWTMSLATPVEAVGTDSGVWILNNINAADTYTSGALYVQFANNAAGNTQWQSGYTSVADSVATLTAQAWDMNYILAAADDTGAPGETVVYTYIVQNWGNGSQNMDFSHVFDHGDANDGIYSIFQDGNNDGAVTLGVDPNVTSTTVALAADAEETFFLTVFVNPNRSNGDSYVTNGTFTDQAFIRSPSTSGDAWETGTPITGNDSKDTQTDQVATWVAGPVMRIAKSIVATGNGGQPRPGDTILYEIIVDNDGSGSTAANLLIVDALPGNCTYTVGSSAMTDSNTTSGTCGLGFARYVGQDTFSGPGGPDETAEAQKLRWRFSEAFAAHNGGDNGSTADDNGTGVRDLDSARIRFEVVVN